MQNMNCPQCGKSFDTDEHECCPHCSYGCWDDDTDDGESNNPVDKLFFDTDMLGEIYAIEEVCPDCGAGYLVQRKTKRDGEIIAEVMCEKCEYYRID